MKPRNPCLSLLASAFCSALLTLGVAPASFGAVLIDHTFDGVANDIGPAFQQVANGLGTGGSSNVSTGVITTGTNGGSNSTYGFNNAATVNITTADPTATGFTATFYVGAAPAAVSSLILNGLFFGIVSGTDATGTGGTSLWTNSPNAFGYVAGSNPPDVQNGAYGDNVMRQDPTTTTNGTTFALGGTAPSDASFADGFTVSISLFADDTWKVTSTGLSTDLNSTGTLTTSAGYFSYADIASDIGLSTSLQGQNAATLKVDRITLTTIPEPTSLALLGLSGLLCFARRRR